MQMRACGAELNLQCHAHVHAEPYARISVHAGNATTTPAAGFLPTKAAASWSRWHRILQLTPQLASLALDWSPGWQLACSLAPLYVGLHSGDRRLQLLALLKVASRSTAVEGVDEKLH